MKRVLLFGLVVMTILSCSKDSFQTRPQIKAKTEGNVIIPVNGTFPVTLEYTDKEGDVDNVVKIYKQRLNRRVVPTLADSIILNVPQFPNTNKGEININLAYQAHLVFAITPPNIPGSNPSRGEPDTLNLKFVLKDKAGNISDTAYVNNVIVIR